MNLIKAVETIFGVKFLNNPFINLSFNFQTLSKVFNMVALSCKFCFCFPGNGDCFGSHFRIWLGRTVKAWLVKILCCFWYVSTAVIEKQYFSLFSSHVYTIISLTQMKILFIWLQRILIFCSYLIKFFTLSQLAVCVLKLVSQTFN